MSVPSRMRVARVAKPASHSRVERQLWSAARSHNAGGRVLAGSRRCEGRTQVPRTGRWGRVGCGYAGGADALWEGLAGVGGGVARAVEPAPRGVAVVDGGQDRLGEHSE